MNIPEYINHKKNIVRQVVFTASFALVFINIYKPFSSSSWYNVSEFMFFVYSSLIILTGVMVVVISRVIMYLYSRQNSISYYKYGLWVFLEILFMSLFYTIYTISVNRDRDTMEVFESSIINTTLVLLLPYASFWLYLGWRESTEKLKMFQSSDKLNIEKGGNISFKDERGVLRFSVAKDDVIYIESSDNYVTIHYSNKGKVKNYLLRNRLKNLEKELLEYNIIRCHRTYLVNLDRVKVLRKEREGIIAEFELPDARDISVSKSYQKNISERFLSR